MLRPLASRTRLFTTAPVPVTFFETPPTFPNAEPAPRDTLLFCGVGALSGWSLVAADALARSGWPYFPFWDHVLGSLGLYTAVGVLLGLLVRGLVALEWALVGRRVARIRWLWLTRIFFYGVVGALASVSTALWTFSGEQARSSRLAVWGPVLFAGAMGCLAASGAFVVMRSLDAIARGRRGWVFWAVALFAAGVFIAHVDLTQYVALYSRVHTILELIAALSFGGAYALLLTFVGRWRPVRTGITGYGALSAGWFALALLLPALRTWFDESLKHVWLEEVYVGRMLRRVQIAEAFFRDPFHWQGMHMARIERLKARYGIKDLSLSPAWRAPLAEPPPVWDAIRALRGGQNRYNVVVYYVDTLRADVAADPTTMPALTSFRGRSLDFRRAYAVGSDTLRSLPALTSGNYDVLDTQENDLLRVAKRADYDDALVIAKSAYEFLGKLRPEFYFDSSLVVEDYPAEQQVWGYGAQRPTAPRLVDRALGFLDQPRKQPFFLWLFNFDQHNWRELDNDYVDANTQRFHLPEEGNLPYRYRVVARSIDEQFERLLQGLSERHLLENTIVLFVSDHGEALGRDGFWVHSVFLWECLIRVPLVLHVPGLAARRIDEKVSLVDVAPTLGRYLDPTLDGKGFQGEDLLGRLLPTPPPRRFPLLLVAASKDLLVRVGLVDPVEEFKLVLSFESALPELYDLRARDPDAQNFASRYPAKVRRGIDILAHSPDFPRTADDFDVRNTRLQKALAPPEDEH